MHKATQTEVMWVVHSTKTSVNLYRTSIWNITETDTTIYTHKKPITLKTKKFELRSAPWDMIIDDDEIYGEFHKYGTGVDDWEYSYYGSLSHKAAISIFHREKNRVEKFYNVLIKTKENDKRPVFNQ